MVFHLHKIQSKVLLYCQLYYSEFIIQSIVLANICNHCCLIQNILLKTCLAILGCAQSDFLS